MATRMTVREYCSRYNRHKKAVYRQISQGKFPGKIGKDSNGRILLYVDDDERFDLVDVYLKDQKANATSKLAPLGLYHSIDKWHLWNPKSSGNILVSGLPQTGKTSLLRFSSASILGTFSNQTMAFFVGPSASQAFQEFSKYPNCAFVEDDFVFVNLINEFYEELQSRVEKFNEIQVKNVDAYEQKTGMRMSRFYIAIDEIGDVLNPWIAFSKQYNVKDTTAAKFITLLRVGKVLGFWVAAAVSDGEKDELPLGFLHTFETKLLTKSTKKESLYLLNETHASKILDPGLAATAIGVVKVPFVTASSLPRVLDKTMQPYSAASFRIDARVLNEAIRLKAKPLVVFESGRYRVTRRVDVLGRVTGDLEVNMGTPSSPAWVHYSHVNNFDVADFLTVLATTLNQSR